MEKYKKSNSGYKKYIDVLRTILGRNRGRDISVFDDDIFITSYPKSGNTWVRFLIGYLVFGQSFHGFSNIEEKIPDIYINTERQLLDLKHPRILKSHEYFDSRYKKVIFIVRDPREVVVSYYSYHKKVGFIEDDYPIRKYVERFVAGDLDNYGSWKENVGSWLGARKNTKNFLLVRYEDLLKSPELNLAKIASLIDVKADQELLSEAVEFASINNMKRLEKQQRDAWLPTKNSRKDIAFVRSSKSKTWEKNLPLLSVKSIENAWEDLMKHLGYLQ